MFGRRSSGAAGLYARTTTLLLKHESARTPARGGGR